MNAITTKGNTSKIIGKDTPHEDGEDDMVECITPKVTTSQKHIVGIDHAKVAYIKKAIADGTFKIDAEKIADKFLH